MSVERDAQIAAGLAALRGGDTTAARRAFERAIGIDAGAPAAFVGLAYACRAEGDTAGALDAATKALDIDPRNLRALIVKADCLAANGDERAAASFYAAAVRTSARVEGVPADLRAELDRSQAACERYSAQFESFLRDRVGRTNLDRAGASRFTQSLDILVGRRQREVQLPRYYYFPGLAAVPFHERKAFGFLDEVEGATDEIRAELIDVLRDEARFKPYIQSDPGRPRREQDGLLDNPAWSAFYLWKDGALVEENAARCPRTVKAMEAVPLCRVPNRSPSVLFSLLRPGAHIPPHTGMVNTRLICHLPLIVPPGCTFRVGGEMRDWEEGKAWVFDDTIEHEAWNRSGKTRVILLFEIWRPELTQQERGLVNAMFEAIDAHSGEKPAWEI